MPYMLLIMEPRGQRNTRTEAEGREVYERMLRFGADLQARGLLLGSASLQSDAGASRVEVRGGRRQVLDGPFAEAKEMVGGFFLLDCATREQAIEIAAECPAAQWCSIEVRSLAPCYEDAT
ncbi:YciI family protein [Caldimonas brevitalea]|uniref:Dehydrogenase n=1 Tax=Caldimonas brevitalea TaxID=413882 RepID=A0A0G3BZA4_9BURK|nr:YciI family protein [Caldimonas brevitalea]AKJ31830.1 dehydrogenase [Caldimonas brevitalea]